MCIFSEELHLVKTMRRLANHGVISRPAGYNTLNDTRLGGKMPLHVVPSCNNTHLKEVSEINHSKHFVIYEGQFVIPKCPTMSDTRILDLIHTNLAQLTKCSTLRQYGDHIYCSSVLFHEKLKINVCFSV
jgi:hypothetical protein